MINPETAPVWKKFYQIVSGFNRSVTGSELKETLKSLKGRLLEIFSIDKTYSKETEKWIKDPKNIGIGEDHEMQSFINRLCTELDVDGKTGWITICNFLMYEYMGQGDELRTMVAYEACSEDLCEYIWNFYISNRMFLLKSWKAIFESAGNPTKLFHKEMKQFVDEIDKRLLWNNLLKSFELNLTRVDIYKDASNEKMEKLTSMKNRELAELSLLMAYTSKYLEVDGKELCDVLNLFDLHGYTRHPPCASYNRFSKPEDLTEIKFGEYSVIISLAHRYWDKDASYKQLIRSKRKNIEAMLLQDDNAVVFFTWMVLFTADGSDLSLEYCNNYCMQLINRNVFEVYYKILSHEMFKDTVIGDYITEAIDHIVVEFFKLCREFEVIFEKDGIVSVVALLFTRRSFENADRLEPILTRALQVFPYDFFSLILIFNEGIKNPSNRAYILDKVNNLPSILSNVMWPCYQETKLGINTKELCKTNGLHINIAPQTVIEKCYAYDKDLTIFHLPYSLFQVMEEYYMTIFDDGDYDAFMIKKLAAGYKLIINILKNYSNLENEKGLRFIIKLLDLIPPKYFEKKFVDSELLEMYFKVHATLVIANQQHIAPAFPSLENLRMLPLIPNLNITWPHLYSSYLFRECFLFQLLKEEESGDEHSILLTYLDLIDFALKNDMPDIYYSGIWFVINVVFPFYPHWQYKSEIIKIKILKISLEIIVFVVSKPLDDKLSPVLKEIYLYIVSTFTGPRWDLDSFMSSLFKDRADLNNFMLRQSNWAGEAVSGSLENIKNQLLILKIIFKNRKLLQIDDSVMMERLQRITRIICHCSLIPYDYQINLMALGFLELLAAEEQVPLLALMGFNQEQVRRLLLDRVRDSTEDDLIKERILRFINICIQYQPAVTAAFFDVRCGKKWYAKPKVNPEKVLVDSFADFIVDYLNNIKSSSEYLKHPLQVGILEVMYNLWMTKNERLMSNVTKLECFWPLLLEPFYRSMIYKPAVYTHILKIAALEMSRSRDKEEALVKEVKSFFSDVSKVAYFNKYVIELFTNREYEDEELIHLLEAWNDFVSSAQIFLKDAITNYDVQNLLIMICMNWLQKTSCSAEMAEPVLILLFVCLSEWPIPYPDQRNRLCDKITGMFRTARSYYKDLKIRGRQCFMSIIINILDSLKVYYENYGEDLRNFLEEIGDIIDYEWVNFGLIQGTLTEDAGETRNLLIPICLVMSLMSKLLHFENLQQFRYWFIFRNHWRKLLDITPAFLRCKSSFALAKHSLICLEDFVKSPIMPHLPKDDLKLFYDSVEAPLKHILLDYRFVDKPKEMKAGWEVYALLMKLNTALADKFRYSFIPTCETFFGFHEALVDRIMTLPETVVDLDALNAIRATVEFIDTIVSWSWVEWYRKANDSFNRIMLTIARLVNTAITVIVRPKYFSFYHINGSKLERIDETPEKMVTTMINMLLHIVHLSCKCLYRLNPGLLESMDAERCTEQKFNFIEEDFTMPRFDFPPPADMTYGRLLCFQHFLTKTLNYIEQKEGTLNPEMIVVETSTIKSWSHYVGILESVSNEVTGHRLYAYLRFTGLTDPWISSLNYHMVRNALESVVMMMFSQVFITMQRIDSKSSVSLQKMFFSELQFYLEYNKRRTVELLSKPKYQNFTKEKDITRRYMMNCFANCEMQEVARNNFCTVLAYWLNLICSVPHVNLK